MILTKAAIEKINTPKIRVALAMAMNFTEQWIIKSIEANKENGPLTTAKALQVIQQETGLSQEDILEETEVKA